MVSLFARHKVSIIITVIVCSAMAYFTFSGGRNVNAIPLARAPQPAGVSVGSSQTQPPKAKSPQQEQLFQLREKGLDSGLAMVDVDAMTADEKRLTLHTVLDNTDTICHRKLRMGKLGDGGWEICDDEDVRPPTDCLVYSFGISNDFSFDDDTAKIYGCQVISIDPSMKQESYKRSELVYFHKVGIGGKTEKTKKGWQLYTLKDLKDFLQHQDRNIDVLKMDVESSEWPALAEMAATGSLKGVKQLLVEYHTVNSVDITKALRVVQSIERLGFKKFYVHKNIHCGFNVPGFPVVRTRCYEIHYVYRP